MNDNPLANSPAKSPKIPMRKIGRFTVTDKIGIGSNGSILLGHDPIIDRAVAIKILNTPTGITNQKQREQQFINEARAAGRLSHPNIVTIYDTSTEGGTAFIAMEYLQGSDLRALLTKGKQFEVTEAVSIACKVADALTFAHNQGVIHRDIKPANIFITDNNQPKVLDFGIARVPNRIQNVDGEQHTLFKNNLMGTPSYMSPEQALSQPVTALTDVYSLGAVLYEMLTSQKPHNSTDMDKLLDKIINKNPKLPHKLNDKIPEILSGILMKAMRKKPSNRYQSAAEMGRDLNKFLASEKRAQRRKERGLSNNEFLFNLKNKSPLFWISNVSLVIALAIILNMYSK
jgi:serine/threonine protein kinase